MKKAAKIIIGSDCKDIFRYPIELEFLFFISEFEFRINRYNGNFDVGMIYNDQRGEQYHFNMLPGIKNLSASITPMFRTTTIVYGQSGTNNYAFNHYEFRASDSNKIIDLSVPRMTAIYPTGLAVVDLPLQWFASKNSITL